MQGDANTHKEVGIYALVGPASAGSLLTDMNSLRWNISFCLGMDIVKVRGPLRWASLSLIGFKSLSVSKIHVVFGMN